MYEKNERLIIFDADGTIIDAFSAIEKTFAHHGMNIGDLESFQKRRKIFKYLGGIKEFPTNLKKQFGRQNRKELLATLTDVYREDAKLFPGIAETIRDLLSAKGIRVGLVTRNISIEPETTMRLLFERHDIDFDAFDFVACIPLRDDKAPYFKAAREQLNINPALAYASGDEHKDFLSAVNAGMHAFMVSYGFEDHDRLVKKFDVPDEIISRDPEGFCFRIRHAFEL